MIRDITLTINGREFGNRLSTYSVSDDIGFVNVITTISGKEIITRRGLRTMINFSLLPYGGDVAKLDYQALTSGTPTVSYTDPDSGAVKTESMRLYSDIEHQFLLNSVDGNTYYKGGVITLRSINIK